MISSVEQLETLLSEPTPGVVATMARLEGDVLLLGVGGKIGPSLARMAKRADETAGVKRRIIGVSRFGVGPLATQLQAQGIETIHCDLLDEHQVRRLPRARNVVFLAGMKFGSTGQEAKTWAINACVPGIVASHFSASRLVVYSTGNVYGLTSAARGGSCETDVPNPVGEYAMSCLGRERIFEYFSRIYQAPATLIRLNYASEPRYGVLVDLASRVWAGQPIDLTMGYLNTIWQGDANAIVLQTFEHATSPPFILNVTGQEVLRVRELVERLGRVMGKPVTFRGVESDQALLSNAAQALRLFGPPRISVEQMIDWIADWVRRGQPLLGKPTRFEVLDGRF